MARFRLLYTLLILSVAFCTVQGSGSTPDDSGTERIEIDCLRKNSAREAIKASGIEPFMLERCSFESDSTLSTQEFEYLSDLKVGQMVDQGRLVQLCNVLICKGIFSHIYLYIHRTGVVAQLHCLLRSHWVFNRVSFRGLVLGKDLYRRFYQISPHDPFDQHKHELSLERIHEAFCDQGYFKGVANDSLSFDPLTKTVSVEVALERGKQFSVDQVQVSCSIGRNKLKHKMCQYVTKFLKQYLEKKRYDKQRIENATNELHEYLSEKGFLGITISLEEFLCFLERSVRLVFSVKMDHKRTLSFSGNHYFSASSLRSLLLEFGPAAGIVPPEVFAEEIEDLYRKKGFWDIKIQTFEQEGRLSFFIVEGERARVQSITLEGLPDMDSLAARKKFYRKFKRSQLYDEQMVERRSSKLIKHYVNQGYWSACVADTSFEKASDNNEYIMYVSLDVGKQCIVTGVQVEGIELKGDELLSFKPFTNVVGSVPISPRQINDQNKVLMQALRDRGMIYAYVRPSFVEHEGGTRLVWRLHGNNCIVRFGKPVLRGTVRAPFKPLMNELLFSHGQTWSGKKLTESAQRIRDLGMFDAVSLYPAALCESDGLQPVILKIIQGSPFEVRGRVGYQQVSKNFTWRSGATYKVGGTLLWKNPTGHADRLGIDCDVTRFRRSMRLKYQTPWLLDLPLMASLQAYSYVYDQPLIIGSKKRLYRATQDGVLAGLNRRFLQGFLGVNFGIEWMRTEKISKELAMAIQFQPELIDKRVPYLQIEPSWFWNNLDDKVYPKQGAQTVASLKAMLPLARREAAAWVKALFEQSFFVCLHDSVVLGLRIACGHVFNKSFRAIMPPERFYLGGAQTVRSYQPDFVPPLGRYDDQGSLKHVPIGGRSMLNINTEVRFPLIGQIGMTVFNDIGVLGQDNFQTLESVDIPGAFVGATGCGLWYKTPVGPLRFDAAFKWAKQYSEQSRYAWFLTLGYAF